ncbi:leucine-rich repeat domain-containing protein [Legionella drozanskii]|uniref:Leucine-rich repeat domain-containing protein n=1 Tax=Legionella drozanskii LLAP-1 TaxID=1212489 RepID=A0A0W0SR99_9GAMM|nr:leucine-rich repeat domain-containing protein [Legionella drozanskii]KTC85919.1 hypothetical protein Ldro_2244 [Legionella drozanskii LLAP-1]
MLFEKGKHGRILVRVDPSDLKDGSFEIPSDVTSIAKRAFFPCRNRLKKISCPEGLLWIDEEAFYKCEALQEVNLSLSKNLTSIGRAAFMDCKNLREITIPESLALIQERAFCGCINLQQINFPESLLSIKTHAFWGCDNLRHVVFPGSLIAMGDEVFTNLDKVFINSSNENTRKRIIELLPEHLRTRVVMYSEKELFELWGRELRRITNTIAMYHEAEALIKHLPLPTRAADMEAYETEIGFIVDNCIQNALELKEPIDNSSDSFLYNAVTMTTTVGGLALKLAALAAVLVSAAILHGATMNVKAIVRVSSAAGTFFNQSCSELKEALSTAATPTA